MARQKAAKQVKIHEDEPRDIRELLGIGQDAEREEGDTDMDESRGPEDESGATRTDESDDSELDESVAEDIARFEESFKGINKRYRLMNRIGEGTSISRRTTPISDLGQEHFLQCTKPKICTTTATKMNGTLRRKTT